MIKEIITYTVICNSCGKDVHEGSGFSGFDDKDYVKQVAVEANWITKDDKHYCLECYQYDDEDNLVFKNNTEEKLPVYDDIKWANILMENVIPVYQYQKICDCGKSGSNVYCHPGVPECWHKEQPIKPHGWNTDAEWLAYEKGREDEEKVLLEFVNKWDGKNNSAMGTSLHNAFLRFMYKNSIKKTF